MANRVNQELDKALTIINLTKFKQEINERINTCLASLQENSTDNNNIDRRIILQVISYYDKMQQVYKCRQESDDEEDGFINEDDDDDANLDNDSDDYTNVMNGRVFKNQTEFSRQENELKRKLLGIDFSVEDTLDDDDNNILDNIGFDYSSNNMSVPTDSSVDPPAYDVMPETQNEGSDNDDDDQPGDPVIRNTKHAFKTNEPSTEIIIDDDEINYDELDVKLIT